jgi:hypothetical protein
VDRIPVEKKFSPALQNGHGTQPPSYAMGTGSFPVFKRTGVALTTHPHLVPRLKKEKSYISALLLCLRGLFYAEFYLKLYAVLNRPTIS